MSSQSYPLAWPDGWKRCTSRRRASFTTYKRQLSVMDGISRAIDALGRMGISRNDLVVSTNIETRLDGLPRSDRAEPRDPGVAVAGQRGLKLLIGFAKADVAV